MCQPGSRTLEVGSRTSVPAIGRAPGTLAVADVKIPTLPFRKAAVKALEEPKKEVAGVMGAPTLEEAPGGADGEPAIIDEKQMALERLWLILKDHGELFSEVPDDDFIDPIIEELISSPDKRFLILSAKWDEVAALFKRAAKRFLELHFLGRDALGLKPESETPAAAPITVSVPAPAAAPALVQESAVAEVSAPLPAAAPVSPIAQVSAEKPATEAAPAARTPVAPAAAVKPAIQTAPAAKTTPVATVAKTGSDPEIDPEKARIAAEHAKQAEVKARAERGRLEAAQRREALKNSPKLAPSPKIETPSNKRGVDVRRQGLPSAIPNAVRTQVRTEILGLLVDPRNKEISSGYIRCVVASKVRFALKRVLPREQLMAKSGEEIRSMNEKEQGRYVEETYSALMSVFPDVSAPAWLKGSSLSGR